MIKPRKYRKSNEIGNSLRKRVVIQIDDINGVPSVYVYGQKLNDLIKVAFDWNTDTDCPGYKKLEIKKYTKTKYGMPIEETMISESAYNKWKYKDSIKWRKKNEN